MALKTEEPAFIQAMGVLTDQPGDVVVLKTDHYLNREQTAFLTEYGEKHLPGVKIMVLTGGLDIGVVRQAA